MAIGRPLESPRLLDTLGILQTPGQPPGAALKSMVDKGSSQIENPAARFVQYMAFLCNSFRLAVSSAGVVPFQLRLCDITATTSVRRRQSMYTYVYIYYIPR